MTEDEKKDWAILVTFQALRTRKFREEYINEWKNRLDEGFIEEYFSNGLQKLKDILETQYSIKIKQSEFDEYKKMISNEETKRLNDICNQKPSVIHARGIFKNHQDLANTFSNHIWRIGINTTTVPLVTSDNPVAKKRSRFLFRLCCGRN